MNVDITQENIGKTSENESERKRASALFSIHKQWRKVSDFLIFSFNFITALIALALTLPIMIIIGIIIRIDSPGPIIFRQKRIGKERRSGYDRRKNDSASGFEKNFREKDRRNNNLCGRPFTFYKFRTMKVNAKELYPELYEYRYSEEEMDDLQFKINNDPRVTRVGRWLRKTTLDELPNFINVLTGDMNLVGPRPELPEMTKYYHGEQQKKFSVKPGLTGLAQINGRGELKFNDTVRYDLEYVHRKSFLLDLKIMLKTIYALIIRRGAF